MVLGAGNVATHISRHLHSAGHHISCIWSRNREHAEQLAAQVGAEGTSDPEKVPAGADFYLLAVPDRAIPEVAARFSGFDGIWMHTAGAVSMDVLDKDFRKYGVLYPLQTLSVEKQISLKDTPFLVEGSDSVATGMIRTLASFISETVVEMDSAGRLALHLAAVFANNFSNHMVAIGEKLLKAHDTDLSILLPILRETFAKIEELGPADAQTGPALRDDRETMEKHLALLKGHPEWEKLYTFVSRDIKSSRKITTIDPERGDDQL